MQLPTEEVIVLHISMLNYQVLSKIFHDRGRHVLLQNCEHNSINILQYEEMIDIFPILEGSLNDKANPVEGLAIPTLFSNIS